MALANDLIPDEIHRYLVARSVREPEALRRLREATAQRPDAGMQSPPEVGQFLALLVELAGARKILELGTFTGYGTLAMALSMPADGRIIACDGNVDAHRLARRFWTEAGVAERIELRVGECADAIAALIAEGHTASFDLAFIDADKPGYGAYYDACFSLLRPGGLMVFDNVLMRGAVTRDRPERRYAAAMQRFNLRLHADERISLSMLPLGDGLTLARIRPRE